jgi:hypothetical protein
MVGHEARALRIGEMLSCMALWHLLREGAAKLAYHVLATPHHYEIVLED